ncbi:hypothetical protein OF83DRAFT_1236941 [Amylostereum chailletii]|nr:hypothetical protein OF83DRAFT_1236941 [Amylostereum chailletii]
MSRPSPKSSLHPYPANNPDPPSPYYDDLIDNYATPYSPSPRHNAYPIDHTSKQSLSTADHDLKRNSFSFSRESVAYPPTTPVLPPPSPPRPWWRIFLPDSIACRVYILVVLLETAIDLAIEGDLLVRIHDALEARHGTDLSSSDIAQTSRKMPVYLTIFCFAHVFQLVLAVDAVYARNTLQFIFLAVSNGLFLVYAIVQSSEVRGSFAEIGHDDGVSGIPVNVLLTVLPIVIAVAELAYIGLGYKIYTEFGWKVYKFLGADRQIKKMFAHYQIFQCLVKFDLFFWVGFSIQLIWLVLQKNGWEYYVTIIALPLSILLLIEGHLAARYENKAMMVTFLAGCGGALVYFSYKFIKVLVKRNTNEFENVWESLTAFSVMSIILLLVTIVYASIVWRNFGRGLKQQITKKQAAAGWGNAKHAPYPSLSVRPNRMSIE